MSDAVHELSVTRLIAAPRQTVYRAWVERLAEWWAPKPWTTQVVAQELRPGGRSALLMRGPAGEESGGEGVFLEVVPEERIVFTNAFRAGWVPQQPFMTGLFSFADEEGGTRYTAAARHWSDEAMEQHRAMGFEQGWGIVAAQLAAIAEEMAALR